MTRGWLPQRVGSPGLNGGGLLPHIKIWLAWLCRLDGRDHGCGHCHRGHGCLFVVKVMSSWWSRSWSCRHDGCGQGLVWSWSRSCCHGGRGCDGVFIMVVVVVITWPHAVNVSRMTVTVTMLMESCIAAVSDSVDMNTASGCTARTSRLVWCPVLKMWTVTG